MRKRFNLITVIVLMALTGLTTFVITVYSEQNRLNSQLETFSKQKQELAAFYEALEKIDGHFVGPTDRKNEVEGAVRGLVESLGDKWSHYFTPEEYRAYLTSQGNNYVGIGVTVTDGDGALLIGAVEPDSPAEEAGLQPGDRITHVGGLSVAGLGHDAAVNLVRGDEYTTISLTIERPSEGGGSFTREVIRREVRREVVTARNIDGVGYIRIANFNDRVDDDFEDAVSNLLDAGVKGLIFDVRDNPGGKLSVLVNVLDLLLPEGDLITLRYKDGTEAPYRSSGEGIDLPMAVLINSDSVSAAELFAADLSEYGRAVLVGEHTGGKGYAQEHFRLTDGSGLYISTSEYFTSKGVSLANTGLAPDTEIVLSEGERRYTGSMNPALDRHLSYALKLLS